MRFGHFESISSERSHPSMLKVVCSLSRIMPHSQPISSTDAGPRIFSALSISNEEGHSSGEESPSACLGKRISGRHRGFSETAPPVTDSRRRIDCEARCLAYSVMLFRNLVLIGEHSLRIEANKSLKILSATVMRHLTNCNWLIQELIRPVWFCFGTGGYR